MSLGRDHLGSMSQARKYPRGDAGRKRPPKNSGTRYDYALASAEIIFFGEALRGQLGGSPVELKTILEWLGLKLECASNIRMEYYLQAEAESRSAGGTQRTFFITHTAHDYQMPIEYVQDLFTREYLYRDEIDPRWALSSLASSTLVDECLPGVVRQQYDDSDIAFRALNMLLRALPGAAYSSNLLEFMFEHHEANGNANIRSRWAEMWR